MLFRSCPATWTRSGGTRPALVPPVRQRARIQRIVDAMPGIVVVGAAANGLTAVSTAKRLDPDVILMDISMPVLDGIYATRQIVDLGLRARVIALTSLEDDYTFHDALRAGVAGFLLKTSSRGEIMHAIQQVHLGESMLSPSLITRVLTNYERGHRPSKAISELPEKDQELLRLIAQGLSNLEIAEEQLRSEERRVGKECRSRWSPYH